MAIGWFGEDLWDAASDAADAVGGALADGWDVFDDLPVLKQLGEGTKAIIAGPLRDFAKTGLGQTVLRAMTTFAMGPIGYLGGPWAMIMSASLPGIARGDSFTEALLTENLWRLEKTAEVLGADIGEICAKQFGQAIQELTKRAREAFPDVADLADGARELAAFAGVDPEAYARAFAAELGIREDMAVQAMELVARLKLLSQDDYDVATGKKIGAPSARKIVIARPLAQVATMKNATIARTREALAISPSLRLASSVTSPLSPMRSLSLVREALASAPKPAPVLERAIAPSAPPDDGLSTGAMVGIGVAAAAAVGAAYYFFRVR